MIWFRKVKKGFFLIIFRFAWLSFFHLFRKQYLPTLHLFFCFLKKHDCWVMYVRTDGFAGIYNDFIYFMCIFYSFFIFFTWVNNIFIKFQSFSHAELLILHRHLSKSVLPLLWIQIVNAECTNNRNILNFNSWERMVIKTSTLHVLWIDNVKRTISKPLFLF